MGARNTPVLNRQGGGLGGWIQVIIEPVAKCKPECETDKIMPQYAAARTNMVDSQIHTAGVVSAPVLEAFRSVPREMFVPENLRGRVYADEDLPLGGGHFLMEPSILARMIEAAQIRHDDVVLNIGDSTGYSSAILAELAKTVMTHDNVAGQASCSLIIMNGAVHEIPKNLLSCLTMNGRLLSVLKPEGKKVGTAVMVQRMGEGQYSTRKLFDAATPYIPGYEAKPSFTF